MKKITVTLITAMSSVLFAQTNFTDGAHILPSNTTTDSLITTSDNWDAGLPVGQQGTITIDVGFNDDTFGPLVNYDILQTGGTFSRAGGNAGLELDGSSWVMNGAGASFSGNHRGMILSNSSTFRLINGNYSISESNRDVTAGSNSSIIVDGGDFSASRSIKIDGGGTFTLNGGSASSDGTFGQGGFTGGSATMNFNGGTFTGVRFNFQQSGTTVNFGGTTSGSATFDDWGTGNGAGNTGDRQDDRNIQMDFSSGSLFSLSMSSATRELDFDDDTVGDAGTAWAEALWNTGRLTFTDGGTTFSGLDPNTNGWNLVSWADASSSSVGVDGGEYFEFTDAGSFGGTLSLGVIPEPSTLALLGLAGLAMFLFRRRK